MAYLLYIYWFVYINPISIDHLPFPHSSVYLYIAIIHFSLKGSLLYKYITISHVSFNICVVLIGYIINEDVMYIYLQIFVGICFQYSWVNIKN